MGKGEWRAPQKWVGASPPFSQVHGHTSPYNWYRRQWEDDAPDEAVVHGRIDERRRFTGVRFETTDIIGIDPCYSARWAGNEMHALVVRGSLTYPV